MKLASPPRNPLSISHEHVWLHIINANKVDSSADYMGPGPLPFWVEEARQITFSLTKHQNYVTISLDSALLETI